MFVGVDMVGPPAGRLTLPLDVMHAIYERITVAGPEIVGVRLTAAAYAHGSALALPEEVAVARPTGVGRALATFEIPIEGRDEWLAAAGLGA
jgi:hypothetical protein